MAFSPTPERNFGGVFSGLESCVVAVVVTYQPDLLQLKSQLDALRPQVQAVVLIDNGSSSNLAAWMEKNSMRDHTLIQLDGNYGIARAQNLGIEWARSQGATHVLLMDQDSLPAPDMVFVLLSAAQRHQDLAAVGPRYLDTRQDNPPPFIRIRGLRLERHACAPSRPVVPVDYLISSGCLIPMEALDRVGLMREDLFIDYVDIEWGLRARSHGLQSYGICMAAMAHSLGETPCYFMGRSIPVHTPLRHYYHVRNAILLYRESWVPFNWKLVDGWRMLLKFGFFSLITPPRLQHLRMMALGCWHGLRGKTGRLVDR